jgi:hypothetical protein
MNAQTPRRTRRRPRLSPGTDVVAIILSIGICLAINLFSIAVLYDALFSTDAGLSENSTQILTGWGGGIIGVIGALVGVHVGKDAERRATDAYNEGVVHSEQDRPVA